MIVIVIAGLIAAGLFFFGGAWGIVLLWVLAMFFVLPWAGIPAMLFMDARVKIAARRWAAAAASLLGGALAGAAWLGAEGYLAYRAWLAIP